MSLSNTDLSLFKAASNLGGAISAIELTGAKHELIDKFTGSETRDGTTIYACIYVKNKGAEQAENVTVHIDNETTHGSMNVQIGLGASAINANEPSIANEKTAPAGVSFVEANSEESGLSVGSLSAGECKAFWLKYIVPAGTTAVNNYAVSIEINFDTGA